MSLAEPGPELAATNARLIAERMGWPDGVLEAVEQLRASFPCWSVTWAEGDPALRWSQTGFYAWPHWKWRPPTVYRPDRLQLHRVLALAPEPQPGWEPPGGWLKG